jgi:hypothetical protein
MHWGYFLLKIFTLITNLGSHNSLINILYYILHSFLFLYHDATALVGQGLLIIEDSWSYSDTSRSVGLLWTSDQPEAENSNLTKHHTHKKQTSMTPAGFEPKIQASDRP